MLGKVTSKDGRLLIVALLTVQVLTLYASALFLQARDHPSGTTAASIFGLPDDSFAPPAPGTRLPPLIVEDSSGAASWMLATKTPRLIVLIGDCNSCSAELVDQCNALWRKGTQIAVVSNSSQDAIRQTATSRKWQLPVYSLTHASLTAELWKTSWRPWLFVAREGLLVSTQTSDETTLEALLRLSQLTQKSDPRLRL